MDEKTTAAPPALAKEPPRATAKLSADELVTKHLGEVSNLKAEDHPEVHRLVSELVEELPTWQRRVVLARFHSHGLRLESRIHPDVFQAALNEALNGRL